jgi:hypothetical protein
MRKKLVFSVTLVAIIVLFAISASLNNSQVKTGINGNKTVAENITIVSEPIVLVTPVPVEISQTSEEVVKVEVIESRSYPPQFQLTLNNSGGKNVSVSVNASGYTTEFQVLANRRLSTWIPIQTNMQSGNVSLRIKVWADNRLIFDEMKDLHYSFSGSSSSGSGVSATAVPTVTYTPKPTPTATIPPGDYC